MLYDVIYTLHVFVHKRVLLPLLLLFCVAILLLLLQQLLLAAPGRHRLPDGKKMLLVD